MKPTNLIGLAAFVARAVWHRRVLCRLGRHVGEIVSARAGQEDCKWCSLPLHSPGHLASLGLKIDQEAVEAERARCGGRIDRCGWQYFWRCIHLRDETTRDCTQPSLPCDHRNSASAPTPATARSPWGRRVDPSGTRIRPNLPSGGGRGSVPAKAEIGILPQSAGGSRANGGGRADEHEDAKAAKAWRDERRGLIGQLLESTRDGAHNPEGLMEWAETASLAALRREVRRRKP